MNPAMSPKGQADSSAEEFPRLEGFNAIIQKCAPCIQIFLAKKSQKKIAGLLQSL